MSSVQYLCFATPPHQFVTLSFYQPQYRPSYMNDQQKIDDWLTGVETLNTPDINPDFFNESNLFKSEKVDSIKQKDLLDDITFFTNPSEVTLNGASTVSANLTDRAYSPTYSDKQLDSQTININSPEMMPVSPNKVCPQMEQSYYDDSYQGCSQLEYDPVSVAAFEYTPSRSSSISTTGSDLAHTQYLTTVEYVPHDLLATDPTVLRLSAQSPGESSQYSSESSNKTFTNLDNVPSTTNASVHQMQLVHVKQEPLDQYQPTVVAEYETGFTQLANPTMAQYSTLKQNDYFYQMPVEPQVPSLTQSLPQLTQSTQQTHHHHQQQPATSGRKRNAHSAFNSTAGPSTAGGSKKPRMTKREKQKMMESDISKFETENRDLRNSIDLLEKQIQFCKRFLSENVAPVIQRQQQQMHFGSPQMVMVEGM